MNIDAELIINSFWFLTIITAALYIAKKRYIGKKEYKLIDLIFRVSFSLSVVMIFVGFIFLII
ncbi:hypothetical protein N9E52_01725 [Alphaproteobacteria bacterium]|jgi:hypothetical protein|nr:hypothetical protein [Alphaproteobacteria bacterium]|tara:strand:- start:295 stop:483 length:189 start_codon:yes stop_codon:yes gene_type:complete